MSDKNSYLGEFELIVMATLVRLGGDAYGMRIRQDIEQRTGRSVSIGQVYATLRRLKAKGLVSATMGEPSPERGGRAKRYFHLSDTGAAALDRSRALFLNVLSDLPDEIKT
jgi:DNA-binding PadR family transcriptional regulator